MAHRYGSLLPNDKCLDTARDMFVPSTDIYTFPLKLIVATLCGSNVHLKM